MELQAPIESFEILLKGSYRTKLKYATKLNFNTINNVVEYVTDSVENLDGIESNKSRNPLGFPNGYKPMSGYFLC